MGGGRKGTLEVSVTYFYTSDLTSNETRIVREELINDYASTPEKIEHILKHAPIRVWQNPEDPLEIRVIDGLHRLWGADGQGIEEIPCYVESYSREQFYEERKQATINHKSIEDVRAIKFLIERYENEGFELGLDVVLTNLVNNLSGTKLAARHQLPEAEIFQAINFVRDYLFWHQLKPAASKSTLEVLNNVGRENFDIFGLDKIKRSHISQAYNDLSQKYTEKDIDDVQTVANHILRITAGTNRTSTVQRLTYAYAFANDEHRRDLMNARNFDEAVQLIPLIKEYAKFEPQVKQKRFLLMNPDVQTLRSGEVLYDYQAHDDFLVVLGGRTFATFARPDGTNYYSVFDGPFVHGFDYDVGNDTLLQIYAAGSVKFFDVAEEKHLRSHLGGSLDFFLSESTTKLQVAQATKEIGRNNRRVTKVKDAIAEGYMLDSQGGAYIVTPWPVLELICGGPDLVNDFMNQLPVRFDESRGMYKVTKPVFFGHKLNKLSEIADGEPMY